MSGWRTSLRIAYREARRARGRTALVLAMIALPVLALSFTAATYDMLQLTPAERLARTLGTADAELTWVSGGAVVQYPMGDGYSSDHAAESDPPTTADILALLPAGSRAIPVNRTHWSRARTTTRTGEVQTYSFDIADPLARGLAKLVAGRAPADGTEVTVNARMLRHFGAEIGSTLRVGGDHRSEYTVVGVVEMASTLREVVILPPEAWPSAVDNWLVDTPDPVGWAQVRELNRHGILVTSRAVTLDRPPASELSIGATSPGPDVTGLSIMALVAGLGVLEVVLLVGPALAVGARHRRRDLALVAAAGGAPAHLRRIVLADGVVLGAGGAAIGIALGVAAAIAGRPLIETWLLHFRLDGYRVNPPWLLAIAGLAVVTGMLAALAPAYTAARQDVVASLTGRRGIVRTHRRWPAIGLALATGGTALAGYGAWRTTTGLILNGLAMAEFGLVLCTPSLVGLLARLGPLLPLAPRIALRDTARNRAATAPAISAVMAAVTGSVAIGVYLVSDEQRNQASLRPAVPAGYVTVHTAGSEPDLDPRSVQRLATTAGLPVTDLAELRTPSCPAGSPAGAYCSLSLRMPAERECPVLWSFAPGEADQRRALADERCRQPEHSYYGAHQRTLVDNGTALPILTGARPDDLERAITTLAAGGVVVTDPRYLVNGTVTVEINWNSDGPPEDRETMVLPAYALRTGLDATREIYSPGALERTGLTAYRSGLLLATSSTPSAAQQEKFTSALHELSPDLTVEVERGPPKSQTDVMLIVLAIAAGLITLGAAGIATGLAAAAGRAELSTLAAVGASPRLRRALSLCQAGLIAGLGSLLGIVAGLVTSYAILIAFNQRYAGTWPIREPYPILLPWRILAVVAVVPLVAMLGAGLLTRSGLPVERRTD